MNKQQIANRIWASANKMRSKIEANEYKDYILGLIFYKFLSDKEEDFLRRECFPTGDTGDRDATYADLRDVADIPADGADPEARGRAEGMRTWLQNELGFFIPHKYLFSRWLEKDSNFTVGTLNEALTSFDVNLNGNAKGVFENIFNSLQGGLGKLGENTSAQTRALNDLIRLIKDIPTDDRLGSDVLGFVYEYLISNFAANAGKKAGEFYTPHEVATLMAEIVAEHHKKTGAEQIRIYDPTSGSGSLLITVGKHVMRHISQSQDIMFYAQELKENTYNLTRMNLAMRDFDFNNIVVRNADSLANDWPIEEGNKPLYVDAVVSNPPYSQHWDPTGQEVDPRFKEYGVAPKSKADYAFLLHELYHLKPDGILTIVLPHGVLFRGGDEEQIRRNLIEKNNIDAIIGMPANIFFGTGIPTLVMVLKREKCRKESDDVVIIDASRGFVKDGKQNRLRECDIRRIVDALRNRQDVPGFAKCVSRDEIRANGYNLNIPRYVDSSEAPVRHDIFATMFGGIPNTEIDALGSFWAALPSLRAELFAPVPGKPYSTLAAADVRHAILANADVDALRRGFSAAFGNFDSKLAQELIAGLPQVRDLQTLDILAADVFRRAKGLPLVDPYALFQALAERWADILADVEILQTESADGDIRAAARKVETAFKMVKKKDVEEEVPCGLKGRIFSFDLVQQDLFADRLAHIDSLVASLASLDAQVDEIRDGFSDDELEAYCDADKDNAIDKATVKKAAKAADDEPETVVKLKALVALFKKQDDTKKKINEARKQLDADTQSAILCLSDADVDRLLGKKWIDPVCHAIADIFGAVLTSLQEQVTALADKYSEPLCHVEEEMRSTDSTLASLISQLQGDDFALLGLRNITDR